MYQFQLLYDLRYKNSDRIHVSNLSTHLSYFYNVNHTVIETGAYCSARSELELELE